MALGDYPLVIDPMRVHERLVPEPLVGLRAGFEWSELNIYDLAGATGRHGVLLGASRWTS